MRAGRSFYRGLLICAALSAIAMPGAALAEQVPTHSVIVIDPASSHLRKALNALSPTLATAARWQTADESDDGDLTAHAVEIDVPWRQSRLTAETLTVTGDDIRLEGVRLENGRGVFEASEMKGPKAAWNALAAFAVAGTDSAKMPSPGQAGALQVTDFSIAAKPRQRGDKTFSSSWKGHTLDVGGLHCVTGSDASDACDLLGVDRVVAKDLSAQTAFSGTAQFKADTISFSMSGAGQGAWQNPAALGAAFTRRPGVPGKAVGATLTIDNAHMTASQDLSPDTPSEIDIRTMHLALERAETGGFKLDTVLDSRFSANVLKGTQFWPAINRSEASDTQTGGTLLPLTATVSADYDGGTLKLSALDADVAGLMTLKASTAMSGLTAVLDRSAQSQAVSGLSGLMGIAVSSFSLLVEDHGMTKLVKSGFGKSPAALLREATDVSDAGNGASGDKAASGSLMSLMMGGGNVKSGLKSMLESAAAQRLASLLDQLDKTGRIDLKCQSTPTCIALAIGSQN